MDKTKQREEFEAWFNKDVFSLKLADKKLVECYWDAWQAAQKAALASIEIERPGTTCIGWVKEAIHEHDDKWIETIKAAGLRVKS